MRILRAKMHSPTKPRVKIHSPSMLILSPLRFFFGETNNDLRHHSGTIPVIIFYYQEYPHTQE